MEATKRFFNQAFDFEERDEDAELLNAGPYKVLHSSFEIAKVIKDKTGGFYRCGEKVVVNTASFQFIASRTISFLKLSVPRIPANFLDAVVSYFRQDVSKEAIVNITYNRVLKRFFLRYPETEETKAEKHYIIYNFRNWLIRDEILIVQIHSHNTMPAFFSAVDDADEVIPGLYGVIGNLDKEIPAMLFRYSGCGYIRKIQPEELFSSNVSQDDEKAGE